MFGGALHLINKHCKLVLEKIKAGPVLVLLMLISQLDAQVFRYGIQAGFDFEPFHTEPFVKASYALNAGREAYGAIFRHNSNPDFESIHARWRYVLGVVYYLESKKSG
jgi:hypothetical protein